jgi:hypothetical protein
LKSNIILSANSGDTVIIELDSGEILRIISLSCDNGMKNASWTKNETRHIFWGFRSIEIPEF